MTDHSHVVDEHTHAGVHDPNVHHSPEEVMAEVRKYWIVFGALAALTGITVWLCFGLKMPIHQAIIIALIVASLKGALVAGFFMHLLSEKKAIYGLLVLTVVFFTFLIWLPWHHHIDHMAR